jgi:hypothetical protein
VDRPRVVAGSQRICDQEKQPVVPIAQSMPQGLCVSPQAQGKHEDERNGVDWHQHAVPDSWAMAEEPSGQATPNPNDAKPKLICGYDQAVGTRISKKVC